MSTQTFSKGMAETLITEIKSEIADVLTKNGISLQNISFKVDPNILSVNMNFVQIDDEKVSDTFDVLAIHLGLPKGLYNSTVSIGKHLYKIKNIKLSYRKYPILAEDMVSGKIYKLPVDSVKRALEMKNTKAISTV